MRIIINDIAASGGGAMSILKSFCNYLNESEGAREHEWIFILSEKHIQETDNIKIIVLDNVKKSRFGRLIFDIYSGKRFISKLKPDVVVSFQNTIVFGLKCPQILYLHQSIPFQNVKRFSFVNTDERRLAVYQFIIGALIKKSIKRADKTVVQTRWLKNAVIKSTKISNEKIMEVFPPTKEYSKYKREGTFVPNSFFYPASNYKYKNHKCIYDASNILNKKGHTNYEIYLTIDSDISKRNIHYLGKLPIESVMEKYNTSTLIFPSYIESVGLPLIEASQMGTIILAADCPYSREVLHGYENAYFFDPFDPSQLASLMEKVISGKIKRNFGNNSFFTPGGWGEMVRTILNSGGEKK